MHPLSGILSGAVLTLAACLGMGRAVWRRAPHWTLQFASGSALLGTVLFVLLILRWAHPAVIVPLCVASTAPLWRAWKPPAKPELPLWLLAPAAAYGFYYLIHALAPEIQPDSAGYHLGLVADWARHHGITERIGFYELLPLGLETLFYPAFLLGGHSAAKLVHFGYFLASVPLILWIGREIGLHSHVSFSAAGLYFLTPIAGIAGTCAYTDAAAAFFPLAAFGAMLGSGEARPAYFHAGLAAGFAYAVKMPGAAAAAAAALWALWRGGRRKALPCCAGILLCAGPWLARNAILTGNPLAPLGNAIFPNDAFHAYSEQHLSRHMASYGISGPARIVRALAWDGTELQGLAGPAILLLPLSLLAARTPQGRLLLAAGLVLLLPWTRNIGARFLLPSLPFLFLALASAAGARGAVILFLLQSIAVSPWLADRYAGEHAWRLRGFPWRAALRLEPEQDYLRGHLYEYAFLEGAAPLAGGQRLLDLYGLPFSYLRTVPLGPLSSAEFDNAAMTLATASSARPDWIAVLRASLRSRFYRAVRVKLEADWPGLWAVQDVAIEWRGRPVPPSARWRLDARPNPGDAWLACDQNPATRWYAWDDSRAGAWWEMAFERPRPADAVVVRTQHGGPRAPVSVQALNSAGKWEDLTPHLQLTALQQRVWRRHATAHLYRLGIRWIAAPLDRGGYARLGRSLRDLPHAWGVEPVLIRQGLGLFRVEPPGGSR